MQESDFKALIFFESSNLEGYFMLTIVRLFGKSPFPSLQTHMNKVANCVEKLMQVFECLSTGQLDRIDALVENLSSLEHEADLIKNDIRNHLKKNLVMSMDRGHVLEILAVQDSIADKAEDIGITFTLRPIDHLEMFQKDLIHFFEKSIGVFWDAKRIIAEIDELLESSFGGIEAEKVKSMVEETAYKEYEALVWQRKLLKRLYTEGNQLNAPSFTHWLRIVEGVGILAKLSEKLTNRIRMILEVS